MIKSLSEDYERNTGPIETLTQHYTLLLDFS